MDKGSAALANTLELQRQGLGWVAALPWNQAPPALRERPEAQLEPVGEGYPGMRAAAARSLVHGGEHLCVVVHSATYAVEQLHSAVTSLARASWRSCNANISDWLAGHFSSYLAGLSRDLSNCVVFAGRATARRKRELGMSD